MYTVNITHSAVKNSAEGSNTQRELNTHINIPRHLHDLGEIDCLLRRALQVLDREDLQPRVVDLAPEI
jgi:hypothetical protein